MGVNRYSFGSGLAFMRPVGGNQPTNPTPIQLATLQDISLDISTTIKELRGQYQFPDDVAQGEGKVSGKAKFGQFNAITLANAIGQSVSVGRKRFVQEAATVPASIPFTYVTTNAAKFVADYGVVYTATGLPLTAVATVTAAGQYSVNVSTGTYTFDTSDASAAVTIAYEYNDTTAGSTVAMLNQLQGYGPSLELYLNQPYNGDSKDMRLFNVKISKISRPTKNGDYVITELDFEAFANAAGQVFEYYEG
ncbi:MAG: hypothetical protein KGL39_31830 [Patescibacteria group bacterium]|nr:hypothetical protein [Patescibacteria group bacterium]